MEFFATMWPLQDILKALPLSGGEMDLITLNPELSS
jgi:hypothetical protein